MRYIKTPHVFYLVYSHISDKLNVNIWYNKYMYFKYNFKGVNLCLRETGKSLV